jgi:hypothetical protein
MSLENPINEIEYLFSAVNKHKVFNLERLKNRLDKNEL